MPSWKKLIISGSDAAVPSVSTTGDFTIDASGDIVLDADGADIVLKDGGTHFGSIKRVTSDLVIKSETSNKHMLFKGNDGGATITALDLDMENAGNATFNNEVDVSGALTLGTSFILDGNTISGIDDSDEFTDDDAHIMTSAAVNDRITTRIFNPDMNNVTCDQLGVNVNAHGTDGRIDAGNDVVAFSTSDKRLKENIVRIENPLEKIQKIGGYTFDWKPLTKEEKKTIHGNEGHDVGVIAQEIQEVLPEVVTERDSGYKAVKYEKIVPLLIESIKEQQKQIDDIKQKCDCLNK